MAIEIRPIATLAAKEFQDRIRNRWTIAVAGVFTAFALAIAYFGAAQQGAVGLRGVDVTIASLVSLVIYLVPLIALMLGYDAVVGERERGSLPLLLSLPITRFELIAGKYLGLAAALAASTIAGFGVVGILLGVHFGAAALGHYAGFMASAVALGLAFLSVSVLISVVAASRVGASGMAIVSWFGFVLLYDLVLLALLVALGGRLAAGTVPALLLLNPADAFRMVNIFGFADVARLYGLAAVVPPSLASPFVQGAALVAWILVPLGIASWRFR
ncbi:MAG TPA: ABC transporter permease subunit [Usitatibacter sp.]|nr:ABC transporter permease subunit [Usitatibacter sp.]